MVELSNCSQIKILRIKVPIEVHKAAHFILFDDDKSSFIKKIINAPIKGKKIVTESKGH